MRGGVERRKTGRSVTGATDSDTLTGVVTMQTVARMAGVSAMTVSRALKSDASVSQETRDRVLDIVRRVGYVPDATARTFATRRSGFVAALVPSLNNSNFAETVHGMSEVFDAAGLQMLLGDTEYSLAREEDLIRTLLERRPEAIVLTGGAHSDGARKLIANADIPIVETWDLPRSRSATSSASPTKRPARRWSDTFTSAGAGGSVSSAAGRVSTRVARKGARVSRERRVRSAFRSIASFCRQDAGVDGAGRRRAGVHADALARRRRHRLRLGSFGLRRRSPNVSGAGSKCRAGSRSPGLATSR